MGMQKRLLDEPEACGNCGADLEWSDGRRVCSGDCIEAVMEREDRLANSRPLRQRGWDAFHNGTAFSDVPLSGPGAEAWQRGWKVAERGGNKP